MRRHKNPDHKEVSLHAVANVENIDQTMHLIRERLVESLNPCHTDVWIDISTHMDFDTSRKIDVDLVYTRPMTETELRGVKEREAENFRVKYLDLKNRIDKMRDEDPSAVSAIMTDEEFGHRAVKDSI